MMTLISTQPRCNERSPKIQRGIKIPAAKNSPVSTVNNRPLTTPPGVDTKSPAWTSNSLKNGLEAILVRRVSGKELKAFRQRFDISARGMAQQLNFSRSYIKRIEGGSLRASAKFSELFFALRAEWANVPVPHPKPLLLIGPGRLADDVTTIVLNVKPRRCANRKCHSAFVPRDRRQKFCSDICRDAHARRKAKAK